MSIIEVGDKVKIANCDECWDQYKELFDEISYDLDVTLKFVESATMKNGTCGFVRNILIDGYEWIDEAIYLIEQNGNGYLMSIAGIEVE